MNATPTQTEMAETIDTVMLDILKNGQVVQDNNGNTVKLSPSAAMLNAIRARIKDLGIQSPMVPGTAAATLAEEAQRRGLKFDGRLVVDLEDDDAATAGEQVC